jgi:hypothetical protein
VSERREAEDPQALTADGVPLWMRRRQEREDALWAEDQKRRGRKRPAGPTIRPEDFGVGGTGSPGDQGF